MRLRRRHHVRVLLAAFHKFSEIFSPLPFFLPTLSKGDQIHLPVGPGRAAGMARVGEGGRDAVFGDGRGPVFGPKALVDGGPVLVGEASRGRPVLEAWVAALGLGAIVAAHLYHALEVDVHAVWELEGLEVGEADHRGAGPEVLYLLEPGIDGSRLDELGSGSMITALLRISGLTWT